MFNKTKLDNEELIKKIAHFISAKTNKPVDESEYSKISNAVSEYLIDRGKNNDKYARLISEFLIKEGSDSPSSLQLQSIKEGNILLEGLAQDITSKNIQDNFNIPLTLYLETEILFHIGGLNGEEYKRIGDDFLNTVTEINSKASSKNPIIKLRYFSETYEEIERYFAAARAIVDKGQIHAESGSAMKFIVSKCKEVYDVDAMQGHLIEQLSKLGIKIDSDSNFRPYDDATKRLNLEGQDEIERLQNEFEEKWSSKEIENSLQLINYVNSKRKNVRRDRGYLKIGHLLITGKGVTFAVDSSLSKDNNIRPRNGAHFVTSIERITNYLWMSLNKNLISGSEIPSSMNVIVNAQIFISRKLEGKLHSLYEQLNLQSGDGLIDKETTSSIAARLYTTNQNPENITSETIESVSQVLSFESIKEYTEMVKRDHMEREKLEEQISELEQSKKQSEHQTKKVAEQNSILKTEKEELQQRVMEAEEISMRQEKEIEDYLATIRRFKDQERDSQIKRIKKTKLFWLIISIILFVGSFGIGLWLFIKYKSDSEFTWSRVLWAIYSGIGQSIIAAGLLFVVDKLSKKIKSIRSVIDLNEVHKITKEDNFK